MRDKPRMMAKIILTLMLGLIAAGMLFPLVFTISNSFMSEDEITAAYGILSPSREDEDSGGPSDSKADQFAVLKLIPDKVTLKQYGEVLFRKPQFLSMFWNAVVMTVPIIAGQTVVASLAAYALGKLHFAGRDKLFFLYLITMLMPFQVTLVPNYIVADRLGLLGDFGAIIWPGIFAAFGVFLLRQFMLQIPGAYVEAGKMDGAGHAQLFFRIVLPMCRPGLAALVILLFIDNWNMVEQPLIMLTEAIKQPLSVYLSRVREGEQGIAFAASALYMAPMLFIFLYGENDLIAGIQLSGLKG
ncbi:carbohydrate ABC transporter permease [Paenibacillus sp. BC26]|uniref:carbohydrate ABC transporter permease n=1 Tax=Paenibacillus sp. BC26 TaxID=1881032 RepID=UPI0008E1A649|nr:carbohydrate ABC transporter permease [Paenibacillus sp. BC26]SFT20390.1 carbohydrate ABC transporter membrane protein 2, CUT1 family [Paenibacillus sp. BC26]